MDDAGLEGMETVTATLSADPKYKVGSPNSATVTIADNDAVVTITALVPNASEAGRKGYFKVSRTGPTASALAVKYTVGGTATNGTDYNSLSGTVTIPAGKSSANIGVIPVDDTVHEGTETVIATLSADPKYAVGSPDSATVNIADND
jgi:serralysin